MKNKIIILFLFSFLIPVNFIFAFTPLVAPTSGAFNPGGQYNPIHIQIDQNPTQAWSNAWNKLISIQYVSACASIYKTIRSHSALEVDMSDPASVNSETSYLNYLYSSYQSCVSRAAQAQTQIQRRGTLCNGEYWDTCPVGNNFVCPSTGSAYCEIPKSNDLVCLDGYVKQNGGCISFSQSCNLTYPNTIFVKFDESGKRACDCKTGYSWNEQRTSCIVAPIVPVKTNEATLPPGCDSTLNYSSTTGISCDGTKRCGVGSQMNSDKTKCVVIPKTETKVTAPVIKKMSEVKATQNEVKKDTAITNTTNLVLVNSDTKVITSAEVTKPKGFWTRFIGWLGF